MALNRPQLRCEESPELVALLCATIEVDNQLRRLVPVGRKVSSPPTDVDLPEIARAITAVVRGTARAGVDSNRSRSYVRIQGLGIHVVVFRDDWARIMPYIQDGTFSPTLFPVESGFKTSDPKTRFSASTIDVEDPLYNRVLGVLQQLFTTVFPVPTL